MQPTLNYNRANKCAIEAKSKPHCVLLANVHQHIIQMPKSKRLLVTKVAYLKTNFKVRTNLTVILADTQSIAINATAARYAETQFTTEHHHCSNSYITMTLS